MFYMLTPQAIKSLRESLELSQTQFAFHLGVCENTIARWERGDRHPHYKHMERIHKVAEKLKERPAKVG